MSLVSNRTIVRRSQVRAALALAIAATGLPSIAAAQVDQLTLYFNNATATGGAPLGGFAYDSTNNAFYTGGFNNAAQAIRKITYDGANWNATVQVGQTDWVNKFLASSSVTDNGGNGTILPANYSSLSVIGDMLLNPAPVTIAGVNYPTGTVAIVVDQATVRDTSAGNAVQPQYSKNVYAYDLRRIGDTVTGGGRDRNGNGVVDWNDAFDPIVSMQDLQTVQGTGTTSLNISRRFAFASNGQSIYFNDAGAGFGGLWKVNLAQTGTASLTKILDARSSTAANRINTEPAVINTSLRDFGGGSGDQVLFQGTADPAVNNAGGISYLVDNGSTVSAPRKLLSGKQVAAFHDFTGAVGDTLGIATDSSGNVFFANGSNPIGLNVFDASGRLAKVFSNAEQRVFDAASGATAFNNLVLDTKTRTAVVNLTGGGTASLTQVLFNDSSTGVRTPVAATYYRVGDFDRDNLVNSTDIALFKSNLALRGVVVAGIATTTPFGQLNPGKLKFDLNGSNTVSNFAGVAIDWKDVKIFQQFAGLSDGDVDIDYDVDVADLDAVAASYAGTGKLFTQGNLTSVRIDATDRDDVNYADLVTLAANWTLAKPNLSGYSAQVQADGDRAFAITTNGTISQYDNTAGGTGAWSNSAHWSNGVPNSPGAVASLLTKAQDDVTLNVDGTYTIGQLNFDNYFSFTLNGTGELRFLSSAAELNAFAASPTIAASVSVDSALTVNVGYATDTVTLSGPLAIAGMRNIAKTGPGRLAVSGPQSHGTNAGFIVSGGTLDLHTDAGAAPASQVNLRVEAGATANLYSTQRLYLLNLQGASARVVLQSGGTRVLTVSGNTSITDGGQLDLTDNDGIFDNGVFEISSLVASARNGGLWNQPGITSSSARDHAQHATMLGALSGAEYTSVGGDGTFSGQPYTATDTLVKYTWYGDSDFNGIVDFDDYVRTDGGFNGGLVGWLNGDFDLSGGIDFDDYVLIDLGFNAQSGTLRRAQEYISGDDRSLTGMDAPSLEKVVEHFALFGVDYGTHFLSAVPEPTAGLAVATAGLGLMRRRRRG